jgi:hypothetical protein
VSGLVDISCPTGNFSSNLLVSASKSAETSG